MCVHYFCVWGFTCAHVSQILCHIIVSHFVCVCDICVTLFLSHFVSHIFVTFVCHIFLSHFCHNFVCVTHFVRACANAEACACACMSMCGCESV